MKKSVQEVGEKALHSVKNQTSAYKPHGGAAGLRINHNEHSGAAVRGINNNVAAHNDERREAYKEEFNFWNTWGVGIEGYSKAPTMYTMDPLKGSCNEFKWLLGIFFATFFLFQGRKRNEDKYQQAIGYANNKYAKMDLGKDSHVQTEF